MTLLRTLDPRRLSVKASLINAAAWALAGNIIILAAYIVGGVYEKHAVTAYESADSLRMQAKEVVSGVYELSAVQERLLRLKQDDLQSTHDSKFNELSLELRRLLEQSVSNETLALLTKRMTENLQTYQRVFQSVVEQQRVIGVSQDAGLLGQLGAISDDVEAQITNIADKRILLIHRKVKGAERSYLQTRDAEFLNAFLSANKRLVEFGGRLLVDKPTEQRALAEALEQYAAVMSELVTAETRMMRTFAELQGLVDALPPLLEQVELTAEEQSIEAKVAAQALRETISAGLILLVCLVAVIMVVGAVWLIKRITKPLDYTVSICEQIALGDISVTVGSNRDDEFGKLLGALDHMVARLVEVVIDVRETSEVILNGAREIAESNESLSGRTEQSAANLEETASAMDQVAATIKNNVTNVSKASELARQAQNQAFEGKSIMDGATQAMTDIDTSTQRVENVISVVDEIAFQTNLLALNASVEAARAGELGRGFAVVAAEVRALAQKSANAAKEVKHLIGESREKVVGGQKMVNQTSDILLAILSGVENVATLVQEIDVATKEQSDGIMQVNQAIIDIDKVTQQNAAMVEEATSVSRTLQDHVADLIYKVDYFKTDHRALIERPME
jgi:methyl-accepting chemotaxis protein